MLKKAREKRFQLILIKPSHYDADGYVVQWLRSTMPSNSLAAVYGLALRRRRATILGPDLPIDVIAIDETNARVSRELASASQTTAASALSGSSACSLTSFPARSISPALSAPQASRW